MAEWSHPSLFYFAKLDRSTTFSAVSAARAASYASVSKITLAP